MKRFFEESSYDESELEILSLHVAETKKAYKVSILAPGQHASELRVFAEGKKITVTNKKEQHSHHPLQDPEYSFSTFTKRFTTLHEIEKDNIHVEYRNNIISITLVKKHPALLKAVVLSPS